MAWQTPKTDWAAADGVRDSDFNRIEGNILELYNVAAVHADVTLYISNAGSDDTGVGTASLPYRTLTKALSTLPKNLNGKTVELVVATGDYNEDVVIAGFSGNILLNPSDVSSIKSITVDNSVVLHNGQQISLNPGASANGLVLHNGAIWNGRAGIVINGADNGLLISSGSTFSLLGVLTISNASTGLDVYGGASAYISRIEGSGNTVGLTATSGGTIMYGSTGIAASVVYSTSNGGRIYSGAQTSMSNH